MNVYLFSLCIKLSKIRNLMGWTQEDLSIELGLSRQKIASIENGVGYLRITHAITLYVCIFNKVKQAKEAIEKYDFSKWDYIENRKSIIIDLKKLLIQRIIIGEIDFPMIKLYPIVTLWANESYDSSDITSDDIREISIKSICWLEEKLMMYFQLSSLDVSEFLEKIHDDSIQIL